MQQFKPKPGWCKIGPGIGVEFDLNPLEIQTVFENTLLDEYGPYDWLKFASVWEGERVIGRTWSKNEISDTAHFLTSTITESLQYFHIYLRSHQLNPNPEWESWKFSEFYCGLNGMPSFHRHRRGSETEPYSLGMVWKVGNLDQTEVVENLEYRKIFEALRRQFRKINKKSSST